MGAILERESDGRRVNFDGLAHGVLLGDDEVEPHSDENVILINGERWTVLKQ